MNNLKQSGFVIVLALVAGFLGGMIANGQPAWADKKVDIHKVIRAEKFELVDEKAIVRGSWDTDKDGSAVLFLKSKDLLGFTYLSPSEIRIWDASTQSRLELGHTESAAFITISDGTGQRVELGVTKDDDKRASISLRSNNSGPVVSSYAFLNGHTGFILANGQKKDVFEVVAIDENISLVFTDKNDVQRLGMGIEKGVPRIIIKNENAKAVWEAP